MLLTVTHRNDFLYRLGLRGAGGSAQAGETGGAQELEVTGYHRLWSASRQDWLAVKDLHPQERLLTRSGEVTVDTRDRVPGVHRVYNFEVETEHCNYAGGNAVQIQVQVDRAPIGGNLFHRPKSDMKRLIFIMAVLFLNAACERHRAGEHERSDDEAPANKPSAHRCEAPLNYVFQYEMEEPFWYQLPVPIARLIRKTIDEKEKATPGEVAIWKRSPTRIWVLVDGRRVQWAQRVIQVNEEYYRDHSCYLVRHFVFLSIICQMNHLGKEITLLKYHLYTEPSGELDSSKLEKKDADALEALMLPR